MDVRKNHCFFCGVRVRPRDGHKQKCDGWQRYEKAKAKWDGKLQPLIDSIRESQRITGDDLNIRVGGHPDC